MPSLPNFLTKFDVPGLWCRCVLGTLEHHFMDLWRWATKACPTFFWKLEPAGMLSVSQGYFKGHDCPGHWLGLLEPQVGESCLEAACWIFMCQVWRKNPHATFSLTADRKLLLIIATKKKELKVPSCWHPACSALRCQFESLHAGQKCCWVGRCHSVIQVDCCCFSNKQRRSAFSASDCHSVACWWGVNAYDCEGRTPIMLAMDRGNRRLFQKIVRSLAPVRTRKEHQL